MNQKNFCVSIIGWIFIMVSLAIFALSLSSKDSTTEIKSIFIGLPLLILALFGNYPVMLPFEFPYFHSSLINMKGLIYSCWLLIVFCCGIGILLKSNLTRVVVIFLCIVRLIILCVDSLVNPLMPSLFTLEHVNPMNLHEYVLSAIFPILYIFYFTRSIVKEQFK